MANQSEWQTTVVVDGRPLGIYDTFSGGEVTSDVQVTRPGGMQPLKAHSATRTYGDATVGRSEELARDHELVRWLETRAGRGVSSIARRRLDPDGAPWGAPKTYIGLLKTVTASETDSESDDISMYELVFTIVDVK